MKITIYNPKYKDDVFKLHRSSLLTECPFVLGGKYDADLENIEEIYLKNGTFLLGFLNDKLVAMGAFRKIDDKTAEIKRMRVHKDFKRQGFGQKIYDILEQKIKEIGLKRIVLDTTEHQISAINFYKKNGFVETYREKRKKLNNAYLIFYEKILTK